MTVFHLDSPVESLDGECLMLLTFVVPPAGQDQHPHQGPQAAGGRGGRGERQAELLQTEDSARTGRCHGS